MAFQTGTSTDYLDLLADVITFVTANGWAVDSGISTSTEKYLLSNPDNWSNATSYVTNNEVIYGGKLWKALANNTNITPGTDATKWEDRGFVDRCYVGIKTGADVPGDNYWWRLQGYTAHGTGLTFDTLPGAISGASLPAIPLWNQSITYWCACTNRRIVLVCKLGTVYTACYLGFLQPYGLPSEWPYPLVVGGTTYENPPVRFSDVTSKNAMFVIPYDTSGNGSLLVRNAAGNWRKLTFTGTDLAGRGTYPYCEANNGVNKPGVLQMLATPDGSFIPRPIVVLDDNPLTSYGNLDGCFFVQGVGNSSESQLNDGTNTYRVFQNVFRVTGKDFWALQEA